MKEKKPAEGFTIVEILVTLLVAGLAASAIYGAYYSQQRTYAVQQGIAELQSSLRAAMRLITMEIRMAGYDPTGKSAAGIVSMATSPDSVRFTMDLNSDGEISNEEHASEDVAYVLETIGGVQRLVRASGNGSMQEVASYIEAFDLVFLDRDGGVAATEEDVASVQITLVGRTREKDRDYSTGFSYIHFDGAGAAIDGDGYHRASLSSKVRCRNL